MEWGWCVMWDLAGLFQVSSPSITEFESRPWPTLLAESTVSAERGLLTIELEVGGLLPHVARHRPS